MHTSQNFSTCTHLISCEKRDAYLVHLTLSHLLAADQVVGIPAVPEGRALLVLGTQQEPLIHGPGYAREWSDCALGGTPLDLCRAFTFVSDISDNCGGYRNLLASSACLACDPVLHRGVLDPPPSPTHCYLGHRRIRITRVPGSPAPLPLLPASRR
jgi:hypothetical protein